MIVVLKKGTEQKDIDKLTDMLERQGVTVNPVVGSDIIILGLVGDTSKIDPTQIEADRNVERIMHVAEPFKKANRAFHPEDTVVDVLGHPVGGQKLTVIAGPCSVESKEQIISVAQSVKASGAHLLRGGAFKPRTSPYAFQGMKPILLKRGLSATIEEWLMSAEYIMAGGNENVILCERGIRTFETYTRNTIDLGAVPAVKKLSHLPILVDPSHATGKWWMVEPLAKAAIAVGADGLMIEVHNDPEHALCDGQQSIKPQVFDSVMRDIRLIAAAVGRSM